MYGYELGVYGIVGIAFFVGMAVSFWWTSRWEDEATAVIMTMCFTNGLLGVILAALLLVAVLLLHRLGA
jgi:hypothetical protein